MTGTSPQNSQMIWRHGPQGGVSFFGVAYDGHGVEVPLAFGNGFEDCDAFGADGQTERGVLDVAALINFPGFRADGCANAEI